MVAAQTNPTFECVVAPIAIDRSESSALRCIIDLLKNLSPSKDVRDACSAAATAISKHFTEMYMREDVYNAIRAVTDNKEEMDKLEYEDKRFAEKLEHKFYAYGLGLSRDKRKRLGEILNREEELKIEFSSNINEKSAKELFTREELEGLPDDYFDGRKTEQVDGLLRYAITSNTSDYCLLMRLAKNPETRKRMCLTFNNRCPENISLLQKITMLRLERAKLLGKNTHAEDVLEDLMAKTPMAVLAMLNNLKDKIGQAWIERLNELTNIKKKDMEAAGKQDAGFFAWDISYYENIRNKRIYKINTEDVKQYFPVEHVIPAILNIYQKMLGLRIVKVDSPSVWHPGVKLYEVWEANEDKFVGHFYLDLYPREGKYSGAAMFTIRSGFTKADGSREYPIASMVANFPKPTPSNPTLFSHGNVRTFMHEMGHVFHDLCAVTKWSRFHGTSTEWDFVEAPSQMLENWCWQPSVLRQISSHHKTGEPLPDRIIETIIKCKNDNSLLGDLNTVFYSLFDMAIHNSTDEVDVNKTYNEMKKEIYHSNYGGASVCPVARLGHMVGGYDACYYSYLWSRVYSADMFATRFLKEGIDNVQTGMDYRREILQPGGSRDAMVSLERFLGRKPNSDAFFKQRGIDK
ncbi:zinc metalloendopeptidase [Coemansia spiralis]|nr:zinc metalloendopeptidase [Coemansia spiralis]